MDAIEFGKLELREQVEYINEKLKEGYTLTKLERDSMIDCSRKTLGNRFGKIGYKFNKNNNQYESIVEIVEPNNFHSEICVTVDPIEEIQESSNLVVGGEQVNNKLLEDLVLNYNDLNKKLDEVYSWYKKSSNSSNNVVIEEKKLLIEDFEGDLVSRSFKLYEGIQKEFADFCKVNNRYKVQDILCQFIKEGLEKYR